MSINEKRIPVLGFAAYSGIGKTTLIERIIGCLRANGMRVAVVKHDGHDFDIDHKGKDSWRFSQAGADISIVCSEKKMAFIEHRTRTLTEILDMVHDVDIILIEGYKYETFTQIGICRKATGKDFTSDIDRFIAVVTDKDDIQFRIPSFGFDDIQEITGFIMDNIKKFSHFDHHMHELIFSNEQD